MALPKRKVSHARGAKRRANWKLEVPALARCPRCISLLVVMINIFTTLKKQ